MSEALDGAVKAAAEDVSLVQQVETPETPGDDAAAETVEAEKPRKSVQDRIDDLTAKRREAEREAEYWKAKALQPEPRQDRPAAVSDDPEPDPADYEHGELDVAYIRDITRREARLEFRREQADLDARRAIQTKRTTFDQRVVEQFPDGEPEGLARLKTLPSLSEAIADVILTSEAGPKLADYLGTHITELNRLSALAPHLQAYELAKIESKLAAATPPSPKIVTDAPEPPPRARGAGGQFKVSADTDDFAAFEKQYRPGG